MLMKPGERWRCTNANCKCEVLVESGGQVEGVNPRCACGAPLKKAYASPALAYLEFLHLQEALAHPPKD
jgi:hypothetical protein